MAAKKPAPQAAAKGNSKSINRNRRSSLERKCLSKTVKRLFKGSTTTMFRTMLEVERHARKKDKKAPIMGE